MALPLTPKYTPQAGGLAPKGMATSMFSASGQANIPLPKKPVTPQSTLPTTQTMPVQGMETDAEMGVYFPEITLEKENMIREALKNKYPNETGQQRGERAKVIVQRLVGPKEQPAQTQQPVAQPVEKPKTERELRLEQMKAQMKAPPLNPKAVISKVPETVGNTVSFISKYNPVAMSMEQIEGLIFGEEVKEESAQGRKDVAANIKEGGEDLKKEMQDILGVDPNAFSTKASEFALEMAAFAAGDKGISKIGKLGTIAEIAAKYPKTAKLMGIIGRGTAGMETAAITGEGRAATGGEVALGIGAEAGIPIAIKGITKGASAVKSIAKGEAIEDLAKFFTKTGTPEDKLFVAQNPSINKLSKNMKGLEKSKTQGDLSNKLIVEQGYKPTNTTERVESHVKVMKSKWAQIESKITNKEDLLVSERELVPELEAYIKEVYKAGKEVAKDDIKALKDVLAIYKKGDMIDIPTLELKKQLVNKKVYERGDINIGTIYKNGMKKVTQKIGKMEDEILSKIPGEFQTLKNEFGALKATYEDVFKADIKSLRSKGADIMETYGRMEGFSDLVGGAISVIGRGKAGLVDMGKGASKLVLGKALKRAKDVDFLIKEGFEGLAEGIKPKIPAAPLKPKTPTKTTPKTPGLPKKTLNNGLEAAPLKYAKENYKDIIKSYEKDLIKEGKNRGYVNPDDLRKYVDPSGKLTANKTHKAASYLAKQRFDDLVKEGGGKAIIIAGGPGSGKGGVFKVLNEKDYNIIIDKTIGNKELDALIKNGKQVDYVYVHRNIKDALDGVVGRLIRGNIKEGMGKGRLVPLKSVALDKHIKSKGFIKSAINDSKYKDVEFKILDNAGKKGEQKLVASKEIKKFADKIDADLGKMDINEITKKAKDLYSKGDMTLGQYRSLIQSVIMVGIGYGIMVNQGS